MNKVYEIIQEILDTRDLALERGGDAFLWLHAMSGDCILWPDEASAENDAGANALARWQLTADEADHLLGLGECDEVW